MDDLNIHSEKVEMYLVSLALLAEKGVPCPIPVPRLAEELDIQTVSANQMVRKLEEEGLLTYQPYKGVTLTDEGAELVDLILRNRRLWEVFFVEKLGLSAARADEMACRMEHITEDDVATKLFEYLDQPNLSPTGQPIPTVNQPAPRTKGLPLSSMHPGASGTVANILADPISNAYLQSEGIIPGVLITVLAASSSRTMLVAVGSKNISLSAELSEQIILTVKESPQHAA